MPAGIESDYSDSDYSAEEEWIEDEEIKCPFCSSSPPRADFMMHSTLSHGFDWKGVCSRLNLDFYDSMRLVNYIRSKSAAEWQSADIEQVVVANSGLWIGCDDFLIPALQDDPLLYAFDTIEDVGKSQLTETQEELEATRAAFAEFKLMVQSTLLDQNKAIVEEATDADYYFGSYAETEIHEVMLKDSVRTGAYRDFVYHNKDLFKDKLVLDVGCGTGILSMFCAKAGARHVYAVDNSSIIQKAKAIASANNLLDHITFIAGKIEEVELPVDKVDIIISEWMGYFLLFEGMFDSVLYARDRFLASEGGIMAPSRARILIAGVRDEEWVADKLEFWNDVYSFKMDLMKANFLKDAQIDYLNPDSIITATSCIADFDAMVVRPCDLDFTADFSLTVNSDGVLNGVAGWFDIDFTGCSSSVRVDEISFSTGPLVKGTHWKQAFFAFDKALDVCAGEVIVGTFCCKKSLDNHRELDIVLTIHQPTRDLRFTNNYHVR